jgi:hypothetical protein
MIDALTKAQADAIPLPEVLKPPQVTRRCYSCRTQGHKCIYYQQCQTLVTDGLAVLCERTAIVLAGGMMIEL